MLLRVGQWGIGAGGHGLAAAYYLARNHGIKDVAALKKGYIGGGNTGRNPTIFRSNYLTAEGVAFYDEPVRLWQDLFADLREPCRQVCRPWPGERLCYNPNRASPLNRLTVLRL